MTVSTETASISYAGNGSTTVFAVPYYFLENSHLRVILRSALGVESVKVLTTDYTVAGAGTNPSTAEITTIFTAAAGETLLIERDTPITQETDYVENDSFPAESHEKALDKLTMIVQQQQSAIGTALRLPATSLVSSALPEPSVGQFLVVNAAGDALEWIYASVSFPSDEDLIKVSNVVIMKALTGIANEAMVQTNYHTSAAAGGAGVYRASTTVGVDNGVTIINNNAGTLSFHLIHDGSVSFEQGGAIGDNSVNDYTVCQAVLTAMAGKKVRGTPGKTYKVNTGLSVPAGTFLDMTGAGFNSSAGAIKCLTFVDGGGITGGTITGNTNASYAVNGIGIYCTGSSNSPSAPTFVTAPKVEGVTLTEFSDAGIWLQYVNGGSFKDNNISQCAYAGIGGVSCNDTLVDGNTVKDIGPGTAGDAYGIFLDRNNGTSETADPRSYRCRIVNNTVRNVIVASGDNGQGIDTHGGVDFVIDNNTIEGCEVGIFATASTISGTQALGSHGCIISNNTIRGDTSGYGILVAGALNGTTPVEYAQGCQVHGNTIVGFGITADGTSGAMRFQCTKDIKVFGNTLVRPRCNGIVFNLENIGFECTNNTVVDPHDSSYATPACYAVLGNNNTGVMQGVFRYENAALATNVATQSIRIAASLTGLDISYQKSDFYGIDATHLTYSENTSTGVYQYGLFAASGRVNVSLVSGAGNNSATVTFGKRFPSGLYRILLTNAGSINPGGKSVSMRTGTVTATTFDVLAYPSDLTTWSGNGTLNVDWYAVM